MGVYTVTQAEYEQVMGKNPSKFKGPQNPVDSMTWNDATEFCKKLSVKIGKTVCLPTEARWEYACRAGTTTRFSFGDDDAEFQGYMWCAANAQKTHPVGQKKPNAWGLYDMHGNAGEWCSDWYTDSYANAQNEDPQGPVSGADRVLRGGHWFFPTNWCRSAKRDMGVARTSAHVLRFSRCRGLSYPRPHANDRADAVVPAA
jgi:formylglycine-generating enzyme required for sulfatase activity